MRIYGCDSECLDVRGWLDALACPMCALSFFDAQEASTSTFVRAMSQRAWNTVETCEGTVQVRAEGLDVPFETEVLDVAVQVIGIDFNDAEEIVAECKRGARVQRIPVLDLPLPKPPPEGFEWIEAYRFFRRGVG
jgi:hypothetical protein